MISIAPDRIGFNLDLKHRFKAIAAVASARRIHRTLTQKAIDENEDGARAGLIEEGLTTWIFETAKRHHFFANTPKLGLDLLKDIKRFVRGYEAERTPMWLWESAVLQGYAVFRELRKTRRGVVRTDFARRKIWYEPMSDADLEACGLPPEEN